MMESSKIDLGIGLDDAELISYCYSKKNNELSIVIEAWNLDEITIIFLDPLTFIDRGCEYIKEFSENFLLTPFFLEALKQNYETIPKDHPYRLFQLFDLNNRSVLEVVCEDLKISITKQIQ